MHIAEEKFHMHIIFKWSVTDETQRDINVIIFIDEILNMIECNFF